ATNHMVLGRNSENGEKSDYVYNGLFMRVKNVQKLEQTDSSYENYGETAVGKSKQAFGTKETNYVIDYLSEANNDLLSYETGFGATRVTYGRGSERLSQNVTIYPETPKSNRTDIAQENNGKSYFQTDRLGSVLFASNQEGEVLRYADRDAWGNLQIPMQEEMNSAGIADSFGFTNYNYDPVLDQYFAQARFYDAKQGRMLAVDPVKTGLNRYLYCKNDPLNYIDPLGATAQNVKAGVSISNKGILTGAANALTRYKKALSSVGNIGNAGSSFTNTNKCSSNKGKGNLHSLSMMVDDDTWYSPSTGNQIDRKTGKVVGTTKGTAKQGYQDSTMNLIMKLEGTPFLKPRINDNGTITIGYGYDFTKESDPDMFNKYLKVDRKGNIEVVGKISNEDAAATIKKVADKLGITSALDDFMNGKGFGNKVNPLLFNQNQYDAIFSYFYSNGKNVFSNSKYNEWIGYGGEYANRAKERKELRDYLINNNGNYNSNMIIDLFVNSKGANIKYDYKDRRENEASVFSQK
ncbi:MAG: RHS repeat domain-containing protein, partial [Velocimicrobium sp.]